MPPTGKMVRGHAEIIVLRPDCRAAKDGCAEDRVGSNVTTVTDSRAYELYIADRQSSAGITVTAVAVY